MVTATWQAGLLSAFSNILAQLLTSWRTRTPFALNFVDTFQFALFAVLATPPNVVWQAWLEAQFPAHDEQLSAHQKEALVDDAVAGRTNVDGKEDRDGARIKTKRPTSMADDSSKRLNKKNTVIKFLLDQTLGAVVNNLLFIAGIGLIRGKTTDKIQSDLVEKLMPTMAAGLKLWPLVSLLNFTLVPLEYRMLLGNVAGLFWGIFLSLPASSE